jgi:hypothetical protein
VTPACSKRPTLVALRNRDPSAERCRHRAQQHWSGSFVDSNANGWSDYAPGDEGNTVVVPAGSFFCAALKWDDWPSSAEDYDLYLTRSPGGGIVSSSNGPQTGLEPPTELACAITARPRP